MKKENLIVLSILLVFNSIILSQTLYDAQNALKQKEYEKVLSIAKELIKNSSANDAIKVLIQLREATTPNAMLYDALGDAYNQTGVHELAGVNYELAEKIDSLNVNYKFKTAELLYKQKRYTDAVNKYLKIIMIDQQNSKAYKEVSNILFQAKLYADAAAMFEKYIQINPLEESYNKITKSYLEIKNYQKAFDYAYEGLQKYPKSISIIKNGAAAALGLKKFYEAALLYQSIPDSNLTVNEFVNAGRAFQIAGNDSMAIVYFEKAVDVDPNISVIYFDLANYYYEKKDFSSAIKYYNAKIESDSTFEPAYKFLGFALMERKDYEGARASLKKSIALVDTSVVTHYWLGQIYIKLDSLDRASEQFIKSLSLVKGKESKYKNEMIEANSFLGQQAFNSKKYPQAITYLKAAINLKPEVVRLNELLALSYHQSGNNEEAIKVYKRLLQMNPKDEIAKKGLRMLSAD